MAARTSELERELKFETPLDTAVPDLRDLVGRIERRPERRFTTVYFDTSDYRLWERGMTLRHRLEEGESEGSWTLKLPSASSGLARERTELSWSGRRDAVFGGVADVTRGVVRREPLAEIVELETTRQRLTVHGGSDEVLGEIDDDVVRVLRGQRRGERFRQVELELVADEAAVVGEIVDRFASARMSVGAAPKLAVALGLSEHTRHEDLLLDRNAPLRDVVRAAVADGLEQLLDHEWRLRVAAPDVAAEDVHKARVAARRLRSNLKTLQAGLDPVWTRHVQGDLKWIGSAMGLSATPTSLLATSQQRPRSCRRPCPRIGQTPWSGSSRH